MTKGVAELGLVLLRVVEPLHVAVGERALVSLGTLLSLCEPAKIGRVDGIGPSSIFQGVIVFSMFRIVLCLDSSFLRLEGIQVQLHRLVLLVVLSDGLLQLDLIMPRIVRQRGL